MKHLLTAIALLVPTVALADASNAKRAKEALQPFNELIGTWRGTGQPEGTREEKQRGFWTEAQSWEWQFKGDDVRLIVAFDKGKHFARGELRPLASKGEYEFLITTPAGEKRTYTGRLVEKKLSLLYTDPVAKEVHRLSISLLHSNRFVYAYEVKPVNRSQFAKRYQVGATKEGVPFAQGGAGPECIVSGGLGTMKVQHKGQTYFVCCSGCRQAFLDDPDLYIKEFEAAKAKEKP